MSRIYLSEAVSKPLPALVAEYDQLFDREYYAGLPPAFVLDQRRRIAVSIANLLASENSDGQQWCYAFVRAPQQSAEDYQVALSIAYERMGRWEMRALFAEEKLAKIAALAT